MESIIRHFTNDSENDTTIEYIEAGLYSCLNCSFTSEDPDYGTDTIHFTAEPAVSLEKMAQDMLSEITDFLDYREGKIEASRADVQNDYDQYGNSTLIAVERALHQITKEEKEMTRFKVGSTVRLDYRRNCLENIHTGNNFSADVGEIGTITKVNNRTFFDKDLCPMCLVFFKNIKDQLTGGDVSAWIPEDDLSEVVQKKWYMTVAEASQMIADAMLTDRRKVYAFCESDSEEAKTDPEDHRDEGGWHGIKRIDGFFDNEPEEFIVAVGHYGGGHVGFGYADFADIEDGKGCARAVRKAICEATCWDADNYIYVEDDTKEVR